MHERGRAQVLALLAHLVPEAEEELDVGGELLLRLVLRHGADDEAGARRPVAIDQLAEPAPLLLVLDAARDPDVVHRRHEDEVPAGQRDVAGDARALAADGILHHLHEDLVALLEEVLDLGAAAVVVPVALAFGIVLPVARLLLLLLRLRALLGRFRRRSSPSSPTAAAATTALPERRTLFGRNADLSFLRAGRRRARGSDSTGLRRCARGSRRTLRGTLRGDGGLGGSVGGVTFVLVFVLVVAFAFVLAFVERLFGAQVEDRLVLMRFRLLPGRRLRGSFVDRGSLGRRAIGQGGFGKDVGLAHRGHGLFRRPGAGGLRRLCSFGRRWRRRGVAEGCGLDRWNALRRQRGRGGLEGRGPDRRRGSAVLGRLRDVLDVEGIALGRAGLDLDLFAEPGEIRVGDDVGYVEKGGLVEADVHERRLHSREDPDHLAFVDVTDDSFLVLTLQVVLGNGPLLDQRDPGLLPRGVDHQDVRHRRILVRGPRARMRHTRADAPEPGCARTPKRSEKRGRPPVSCLRAPSAAARLAHGPRGALVCSPIRPHPRFRGHKKELPGRYHRGSSPASRSSGCDRKRTAAPTGCLLANSDRTGRSRERCASCPPSPIRYRTGLPRARTGEQSPGSRRPAG